MRKLIHVVYEFVEAFVITASVFVVVYLFLMQPHQVKGSSMFPTFKDKEYLLTDKITYKRVSPKRGDVIVFKSPMDKNFDFIKRVIAIPGDTVMVRDGNVYLNQVLLQEPYLDMSVDTKSGQFLLNGESYTVNEGEVVVFGDNRNHSSDSRDWGPVPEENIVGKVFFRYWPVDTVGGVTNPYKNQ